MVILSVQNYDRLIEPYSSDGALYIEPDSELHVCVPPVFFVVPVRLNVKIPN